MRKLLTGLAAASAVLAFASAAQAECIGNHNVTASAKQTRESVTVSADKGTTALPAPREESIVAQAKFCADGQIDCSEETNSAPKH